MSPEETARCIDLIKRLSQDLGLTILSANDMELVFAIARTDHGDGAGATIVQGLPEEVRRNQQVQTLTSAGMKDAQCKQYRHLLWLSHISFERVTHRFQRGGRWLLGRNEQGKAQ